MRSLLEQDGGKKVWGEEKDAVNPYVFIVGCARSGTTLLRRMLDAHPDIAITRETHWIAKWFERQQGVTPDGYVTDDLLPTLVNYEKFARMGIDEAELRALIRSESPLTYARFVSFVFDLYGRDQGKNLVGDKTPSYVLRIPMLHALWPTARFVHLIRDGRDVALSMLAWERTRLLSRFSTWKEHPLVTAALVWASRVRLGIEAGRELGPKLYHEVRYESLVARPAEESARLCDFLGVPCEDAMLRFHEGRERHDSGLSAKKAWRPITAGLRDWRSEMASEGIGRFEAAAGDVLGELGYERAAASAEPEHHAAASLVQDAFKREIKAAGGSVPKAWSGG
jgi:Sulfotransferase family